LVTHSDERQALETPALFFMVDISPLSTYLMPNFTVSLPQQLISVVSSEMFHIF